VEFDAELVTNGEMQQDLMPVGDLPALEKRIESGLAAYHRILKMAVKYTHAGDWVDQNGVPYLMATGAERIARPFGISVQNTKTWREDREDNKGKYYIYFCRAVVGSKLLDAELTFEGTCSSRDKFFAMTKVDGKSVLRPTEDVDETNIRKKAWTNMFINGVTRLLGLRRLTFAFLAECGIVKAEAARVDYGGKGASDTISEAQGKLLYAKAKSKTDGGASMEMIKEDFKKEFGVDDFRALPKNRMNDALAFIEAIKV